MADSNSVPLTPGGAPRVPLPLLAAGGLYLRGDDNVRITSYNAAAGVTLSARSRMLDVNGAVQANNDQQVPNTDRTAKQSILITDEGWLLGGEVFASAGSPLDGQCFVVVEVVRGETTGAIALQLIAAGYVTAKQPLVFPASTIGRALEGGGALRSITGAVPAAGAEVSETVPAGARWELLALRLKLTADANVANRSVVLLIDDGTLVYAHTAANLTITAGLVGTMAWFQGPMTPFAGLIGAAVAGLPVGLPLGAGHRIRTSTTAIQVGDQYSIVQYLVRERIEGA